MKEDVSYLNACDSGMCVLLARQSYFRLPNGAAGRCMAKMVSRVLHLETNDA